MKTGCTVYIHATRGLDLSFCQNIDSTYNKSVIPQYVSVYNVCLGTVQLSMLYLHVHVNMYVLSDTNKTQKSPIPVLFLNLFKTLKLYRLELFYNR